MPAVTTTHHTRGPWEWEVGRYRDHNTGQELYSVTLVEDHNNAAMIVGLTLDQLRALVGACADAVNKPYLPSRDCDGGLAEVAAAQEPPY